MSEETKLTECPECKGELFKVFGTPMIKFNGTGFNARKG
jgi:predicted nucleic acid-binding Zn ribbon protein